MINLIPSEGHRVVKREYMYRAGATLSFLFGCVAVILGVAHVPTYVLVGAQIHSMALVSEKERIEEQMLATATHEISDITKILTQLKKQQETISPSHAIATLEERAPQGISFKTFLIQEVKGRIDTIQVQGTATTRETLVSFKRAVENTDLFEAANIPIADLARDVNLPFTLTVTVAP